MDQDDYNQDIHQRARNFEEKLASGEQFFCDTDDLEELIEFYMEIEDLNKAWDTIHYGLTLYPNDNYLKVKKAEVLLNRREIKHAIRLLDTARGREPNNPEIAKLLGDCYNFSMQYKRAVDYYHQALKEKFELDDVVLQLIRIHFILDKPEKAVSYLKIFPDQILLSDLVIPEIIKLLTDFRQTKSAIDFLRQLIAHTPYTYSAWYFMGYCFQKIEEFENAIDAFEYCIAIDERNSMGHLGKGNSLMELNRHEEAIEFFKQAIDHDITDAEVYCNIAECYEHLNNLNSAKYYYLKALKTDKQLSDAYYGLGIIYKKQKRYKDAEKNMLKAIDLDNFESLYHIEVAEVYLLLDDKERCFLHYQKAKEIDPTTSEILLDYAQAMLHFEEIEHAVSLLKDKVDDGLEDYRFMYRIASYLFHLGTYESAYNYLHRSLELNPKAYLLLYEYAPFVQSNETVTNIIDLYQSKQ